MGTKSTEIDILEKVVIQGDLSSLNPQERLMYYSKVCESLGLNPLTKPFDYLQWDGKLVLYAKRDATDQLRKINKVSISIVNREKIGDVYCVTARGTMSDGRTDDAVGVVPLLKKEKIWDSQKKKYQYTGKYLPLNPDELAIAIMKAETKAKRRVTLSIVGLGMMDESELETINGQSEPIQVEGEVVEPPQEPKNLKHETKSGMVKETKEIDHKKTTSTSSNLDDRYRVLDAETGKTGKGTDYMKLVAENLSSGQKVEVYANTPKLFDKISEIEGNGPFEMSFTSESGVNVIEEITVIKLPSNRQISDGYILIEKETGTSPNNVPFAKLKVEKQSDQQKEIVLVRDASLLNIVEKMSGGETFYFDHEVQNNFKVITSLQILDRAA